METDIEFELFCKETVKTNSDILTKWLHSDDFFKKALAGIIIATGSEHQ